MRPIPKRWDLHEFYAIINRVLRWVLLTFFLLTCVKQGHKYHFLTPIFLVGFLCIDIYRKNYVTDYFCPSEKLFFFCSVQNSLRTQRRSYFLNHIREVHVGSIPTFSPVLINWQRIVRINNAINTHNIASVFFFWQNRYLSDKRWKYGFLVVIWKPKHQWTYKNHICGAKKKRQLLRKDWWIYIVLLLDVTC